MVSADRMAESIQYSISRNSTEFVIFWMNKKRFVTEFKLRYELVYVNIRMQKDCLNINHVMLTSLCKNGRVVVLSTTQILKHMWTRGDSQPLHLTTWNEHINLQAVRVTSLHFYRFIWENKHHIIPHAQKLHGNLSSWKCGLTCNKYNSK